MAETKQKQKLGTKRRRQIHFQSLKHATEKEADKTSKSVGFSAPPFQEYNLWLSQYIKYTLFFGYYMLGANVPPKEYCKDFSKKYGVEIQTRGRKRDINIETKSVVQNKRHKWDCFTLGTLNDVEHARSLLPPEIYAGMNPAQWAMLYERISELWEEYALLRKWYLEHNAKLIGTLMRKSLRNRTLFGANDESDLLNEAYRGAARAYDKYKYTSGMRIATLMGHHISNVTKELIDSTLSIIRTPGYVQGLKRKVYEYVQQFKEQYGREPTKDEVEKHVGKTKTSIENVFGIEFNQVSSLDAPVGDEDGCQLHEIIADQNNELYEKYYSDNTPHSADQYIKDVFQHIRDPQVRTAALAALNHGATGSEAIALISETFNCSREKARKLLNAGHRYLRRGVHTCLLRIDKPNKPNR